MQPFYLAASVQGPRERLEDSYGYSFCPRSGSVPPQSLLVISDGLGGMTFQGRHYGAAAAQAACKAVCELGPHRSRDVLEPAVGKAVEGTLGHTTCSFAIATYHADGRVDLRWSHIGDTALFRLDPVTGGMERLTEGHTYWHARQRAGLLVPGGRGKSLLLRSLPANATDWERGQRQLTGRQPLWLVATTDGFLDAFDLPSGETDFKALSSALLNLVSTDARPDLADAAVMAAAEKTEDNATLAMLYLGAQ